MISGPMSRITDLTISTARTGGPEFVHERVGFEEHPTVTTVGEEATVVADSCAGKDPGVEIVTMTDDPEGSVAVGEDPLAMVVAAGVSGTDDR